MARHWKAAVETPLATMAVATAKEIASRILDADILRRAQALSVQQSAEPESVVWRSYLLSQGDTGVALMAAYFALCFPGENWKRSGHRHLAQAMTSVESKSMHLGLFSGLSGLAFTAYILGDNGLHYRKLLASIEQTLCPQARLWISALSATTQGLQSHQFDVINGVTGIGAYLLYHQGSFEAEAALHDILTYLVWLLKKDSNLPRWHIPFHINNKRRALLYAHGYFNCGLAHGVPGPLALLALAKMQGLVIPGIDDSIEATVQWLLDHRVHDEWENGGWPAIFPCDENEIQAPLIPARSAWCYGTPGVARALWLAGKSLQNLHYQEIAIAAMRDVYAKPLTARNIDGPGLCHGVASLLQITLRFLHDTNLPIFKDAAHALTGQLLFQFDQQTLLGYRDLELNGVMIDDPGWLNGTPGVAMALLAAATGVEPNWDRVFLIS